MPTAKYILEREYPVKDMSQVTLKINTMGVHLQGNFFVDLQKLILKYVDNGGDKSLRKCECDLKLKYCTNMCEHMERKFNYFESDEGV